MIAPLISHKYICERMVFVNSLVTIKGNKLFTDSLIIAEGAQIEHESVIRMIEKYTDKL